MNTEITICRQFAADDSSYWQLRMIVGCQTFLVGMPCDEHAEAIWLAEQLRTALCNAGASNVRVGEVESPFDRLENQDRDPLAALAADESR